MSKWEDVSGSRFVSKYLTSSSPLFLFWLVVALLLVFPPAPLLDLEEDVVMDDFRLLKMNSATEMARAIATIIAIMMVYVYVLCFT